MRERLHRQIGKRCGVLFTAVAVACALGAPAFAAEDEAGGELLNSTSNLAPAPSFTPFPLVVAPAASILGTNPRSGDATALRLQLNQPLALETTTFAVDAGPQQGLAVAASSLDYRLDDELTLSSGIAVQQGAGFTPVASIHCQGGTLASGSYRASNCYLMDDASRADATTLSLEAGYAPTDEMRGALRLFRTENDWFQGVQPGTDLAAAPLFDPLGLELPGRRGLMPAPYLAGGARAFNTELTGIDLEFQLGVSMDQAGDLVFGLQLTRILDSDTTGVTMQAPGLQQWNIAEPYDNARLSIDWNKGAFSGGVASYYRSPVDFLNRGALDRYTNFDVHFTWRAPWNASLSVGASNVLGSGTEEPALDAPMADPFESIYGRIPYVRYKQDL